MQELNKAKQDQKSDKKQAPAIEEVFKDVQRQGDVAKSMLRDGQYKQFMSQARKRPEFAEDRSFGEMVKRRKANTMHKQLKKAVKMGKVAAEAERKEEAKMTAILQSVGLLPQSAAAGTDGAPGAKREAKPTPPRKLSGLPWEI